MRECLQSGETEVLACVYVFVDNPALSLRARYPARCGLSAQELEKGGHQGGWDVPGALSVLLGDAVDLDCPRLLRARGALLCLFT